MIVSSALMIWKGLMVVTSSESPIVVVLRYLPELSVICIVSFIAEFCDIFSQILFNWSVVYTDCI